VVATLWSHRSARQLGIDRVGPRDSWWLIAGAVSISGVMIAVAWKYGTLHVFTGTRTPPWHVLLYAIWALLQQFLTQSFVFVRLESALNGCGRAVFWTAALFSAAHLPNLFLVPTTFVAGLAFSAAFSRYRNIYPLAGAHAILGLGLAVSVPDAVTHYMRVGSAYLSTY